MAHCVNNLYIFHSYGLDMEGLCSGLSILGDPLKCWYRRFFFIKKNHLLSSFPIEEFAQSSLISRVIVVIKLLEFTTLHDPHKEGINYTIVYWNTVLYQKMKPSHRTIYSKLNIWKTQKIIFIKYLSYNLVPLFQFIRIFFKKTNIYFGIIHC